MPSSPKENDQRPVLSDHKREGKRFIPPMLQLGEFHDARWTEKIIPEVLWIALLIYHYGIREGNALSLVLARVAAGSINDNNTGLFAATSSYRLLSEAHQLTARAKLPSGELQRIRMALLPLVANYPDCPLKFLFDKDRLTTDTDGLTVIKEVVEKLFNRHNEFSTFVQAAVVYIAFVTDRLKAVQGTALANFSAIEDFPSTEESHRVAGSVRSAVSMLLNMDSEQPSTTVVLFLFTSFTLRVGSPL